MAKPVIVDFSEAGEGGEFNPRLVEDGDYIAKITKAVVTESKAGNPQAVFTLTLGGVPRATYPYYAALSGKAAFKLRNLLTACGLKPAAGRMKLDVDKLVGRTLGAATVTDEYEGREKSVIDAVFPKSDVTPKDAEIEGDEDDEEEIEEPAPKTRKKKAAPVVEDEDDDEELEEEDEEEEPAPKPKRKRKPAPEPEPDEDDEEDEEEEPAPRKRRATKKKAAPVEDDDDEEIDLDDI